MKKRFLSWLLDRLQARLGEPNLVVRTAEGVYLNRWWLIPKNRFCNLFLHQFLKDDDDARALHDHPFASLSICLRGAYSEESEYPAGQRTYAFYGPGAIRFRWAKHRHCIRVEHLPQQEAWTLFLTGPRTREWGFWCPKGFVPRRQYREHIGCE